MRRPIHTNLLVFMLTLFQVLFFYSASQALINRYVKIGGDDGAAGDTMATAYGSLTKAVQDLAALNIGNNPLDVVIHMQAGTYTSSAFSLTDLNSLTSVKILGDKEGAVFPSTGDIIIIFTNDASTYGIEVINQTSPLTFENCDLVNDYQHIMTIQNSSDVLLRHCSLASNSTTFDGLHVDADSRQLTIDSCFIKNTVNGVIIDHSNHVTIQNTVLQDNQIGLKWINSEHGAIVNNLISSNSVYGIRLENENVETVLFNNIITNNGTQLYINDSRSSVERQIGVDPETGDPIYNRYTTWRSTANVITPLAGQNFAENNGTLIYNQMQWQAQVGRDYWGSSFSYPIAFEVSPSLQPVSNTVILGLGIQGYRGVDAPTFDLLGQPRPQQSWDPGVIELSEGSLFHHIELSPDSGRKPPQAGIQITASIVASDNSVITSYTTTRPFYLFLHTGSNPASINSLSDFSGNQINPTGIAGLFEIAPGTALASPFQFSVHRNASVNSGTRYYCRIIEWDDWQAGTSLAYGGRGNNTGTSLFWSNLPDPSACQLTASSPILASGLNQHKSTVTVNLADSSSSLITNLSRSDFSFKVINGKPVDWDHVYETSTNGVYRNTLAASQAGIRTIEVKALGVTITDQLQVDFQPGLHGTIMSTQASTPVNEASIAVLAPDGTVLAQTTAADDGSYTLLVPSANDTAMTIRISDPAGRYPLQDQLLAIPSDRAIKQDFMLEPLPAHPSFGAHTYPNPAQRGQLMTIPYNLPHSGQFKLAVYDLRGRLLTVLYNGPVAAGQGQINWYGTNQAGKQLAPGTYRLVLRLNQAVATHRFVIRP